MTDRRFQIVAESAAHLVNAKSGGALLAASAVAAAAWHEWEHRRVLRADLPEAHIRVERLSDLRGDTRSLEAVEAGLRKEWGAFGLLGFENIWEMAKEAGQTIFIASVVEDGLKTPAGALQTIRGDYHGEPELLHEAYADFATLTGHDAWRKSQRKAGDTAVLLQITVFAKDGRGGGLGSLLRDAVLHMLPDDVHFAITTTPADGGAIDLTNSKSFNPAMRFHAKGGATPTLLLPSFKRPLEGETPSPHGQDVIVMRYARDEDGQWSVPQPEMRTRSMGPMEIQVTYAVKRLSALSKRSERALSRIALRRSRRTRVQTRAWIRHQKTWVFGQKAWLIDQAGSLARHSRSLVSRMERAATPESPEAESAA
jgi:hypothetical protein